MRSDELKCLALPRVVIVAFALVATCSPCVLAQRIEVNEANPSYAEQGTTNLEVTIKGKGFRNGSVAEFVIAGTENPGGITVNATHFVDGNTLRSNIDVASNANLSKFDIIVSFNRRTGKGKELFAVVEQGATDPNGTVQLFVDYAFQDDVESPYQIQPDGIGTYDHGVEGISAILDKGSDYKLTMSRDPDATDCEDPQEICYTRYFEVTLSPTNGPIPGGWQDGPAKLFLAVDGVGEAPTCGDGPPLQLSARGQVVGLERTQGTSFQRYTPVYNLYWTSNVYACQEVTAGPGRQWSVRTVPGPDDEPAEALLQVPKTRGNGWKDYGLIPMAFELTATEVTQ